MRGRKLVNLRQILKLSKAQNKQSLFLRNKQSLNKEGLLTSAVFALLIFSFVYQVIFAAIPVETVLGSDFLSYLTGASLVRESKGKLIYDLDTQLYHQQELIKPYERSWVLPFKSPPPVALLFLPLSSFSFLIGYKLFAIVNLLLLTLITFLLAKSFRGARKFSFWFLIPSLFLSSAQTIIAGQISFILTLLVLALFISINSQKQFLAGLVTAALLLKPQYIIAAPFFFLLSKKRLHFVEGFIVSSLFLALVSIAVSGLDSLLDYPSFLLSTENPSYGSHLTDMFTLNSTLLSFPGVESLGYGYSLIFSGVFYLLVLYLFIKRYDKVSYAQSFISATIFFLVFGIHVQSHDLSILLVPIFLLLQKAALKKKSRINIAPLAALTLFLLPNIIRQINPIAGTLVSLTLAIGFLFLEP